MLKTDSEAGPYGYLSWNEVVVAIIVVVADGLVLGGAVTPRKPGRAFQ